MRLESLAEAALAAHLVWILWLGAGMPLGVGFGWPRLRLLHGASVAGQLAIQLSGAGCPITTLEHWLGGGPVLWNSSWLSLWLERLVYPPLPPGLIVCASALWGAVCLATLVIWPPRALQRVENRA